MSVPNIRMASPALLKVSFNLQRQQKRKGKDKDAGKVFCRQQPFCRVGVGTDARVGDVRAKEQVPGHEGQNQPKAVEPSQLEFHFLSTFFSGFAP